MIVIRMEHDIPLSCCRTKEDEFGTRLERMDPDPGNVFTYLELVPDIHLYIIRQGWTNHGRLPKHFTKQG